MGAGPAITQPASRHSRGDRADIARSRRDRQDAFRGGRDRRRAGASRRGLHLERRSRAGTSMRERREGFRFAALVEAHARAAAARRDGFTTTRRSPNGRGSTSASSPAVRPTSNWTTTNADFEIADTRPRIVSLALGRRPRRLRLRRPRAGSRRSRYAVRGRDPARRPSLDGHSDADVALQSAPLTRSSARSATATSAPISSVR